MDEHARVASSHFRTEPRARPSMSFFNRKPSWLGDIPATHIRGKVWEIVIDNYGPAYVGPYRALRRYLEEEGKRQEAHHLLGVEHLAEVSSRWNKSNAPAVAVEPHYHKNLEKRKTAEQQYIGGRASATHGRPPVTPQEISSLYQNLYGDHMKTTELNSIVQGMISQTPPPAPKPPATPYRSC